MGDGLGPGTTSVLSSQHHRTAPRNASGTFLGASSVCTSAHRSTTPQCTIPVTTPHSTSLLHHYYKHITATATNTHLPHLAMLMMPVMSSTPTCSNLLIHFPSSPLGDRFPATTRFDLDLDLDSDVVVDVDLGCGPALLAACCLSWQTMNGRPCGRSIDRLPLHGCSPLCSIWFVATHVADGLHGLMDLTCTWRDLGPLLLPHPTTLHLGTLLEPSLVHRQGIVSSPHQHQITYQFLKYILYPEYHPQCVASAINQATDTFLTSILSLDNLLTFAP